MSADYDVLSSSFPSLLADLVRRRMAEGWEPQGGVQYAGGVFYQAMVTRAPATANGEQRLKEPVKRK